MAGFTDHILITKRMGKEQWQRKSGAKMNGKTPLKHNQELAKPPRRLFYLNHRKRQTDHTRKCSYSLGSMEILALCSSWVPVRARGSPLVSGRCLLASPPSLCSLTHCLLAYGKKQTLRFSLINLRGIPRRQCPATHRTYGVVANTFRIFCHLNPGPEDFFEKKYTFSNL